MADETVLTAALGAVWVQKDGPNTKPEYVGCVDLGDISEPSGDTTLIQCFDEMGGWKTVGQKYAVPGVLTTQLTQLLFPSWGYLEQITGLFSIFIHQRTGGRPDIFQNFVRTTILNNCKKTSRTDSNLVHHIEINEASSAFAISADNPATRTGALTGARLGTTEILGANAIFFRPCPILWNQIDPLDEPGKYGAIACNSAVGPATANVLFTANKGQTWAAGATDPFGAGLHVQSITAVFSGRATVRWIAALQALGGATQGLTAYSDDNGTLWIPANVSTAAAGHGAIHPNALFAIDQYNIWMAGIDGEIYKSEDMGGTWITKEAGILVATDYNAIRFDGDTGLCVGVAGVVAVTTDGGDVWALGGVPVAEDLVAVAKSGNFWWVITVANKIYYSADDGATWTRHQGQPSDGVGVGVDIVFWNDLVGYLAYDTGGGAGHILRTIDGGFTWESVEYVTNSGLHQLFLADANIIYSVGPANGALAFISKHTLA